MPTPTATLNREQRRALERAGIPTPSAAPRSKPSGPDFFFPAMLSAATTDCDCKPCRLLRKAAAGVADLALEEDPDGPGDQDS